MILIFDYFNQPLPNILGFNLLHVLSIYPVDLGYKRLGHFLGPLLFLISIDDLCLVCNNSLLILFIHDTNLFKVTKISITWRLC